MRRKTGVLRKWDGKLKKSQTDWSWMTGDDECVKKTIGNKEGERQPEFHRTAEL